MGVLERYPYFFLKTYCGYLLGIPCGGFFNKYPQHMFLWRNMMSCPNYSLSGVTKFSQFIFLRKNNIVIVCFFTVGGFFFHILLLITDLKLSQRETHQVTLNLICLPHPHQLPQLAVTTVDLPSRVEVSELSLYTWWNYFISPYIELSVKRR